MLGENMVRLGAIFLFFATTALAQNAVTEDQLAGTWVAVHRSLGGIGSTWEFQRGGKLRMTIGAIVEEPYKIKGNEIITPPGSTKPDAKPMMIRFRVEGDTMFWGEPGREARLKRLTPAESGVPSIVGQWSMDAPATLATRPGEPPLDEKQREAMAQIARDTIHEYTRDGLAKVRVGMRSQDGTYDLAAQTFTLGDKTGHFHLRDDGLLVLTQPDGKTEDVYIRSAATKEELKRAGVNYGGKPADLDRDPEKPNPKQ